MNAGGQEQKIDNYDLWQKFQKDGDETIRNKLVLENLSLVKFQAQRLGELLPDFISREDLESYGIIGLLQAIDRFDSERGIKFSTFASKRIRGAMIDHLRKLDWLPHSMRREAKEVMEAREQLKSESGREPDMDELAEATSLSKKRIEKIHSYLDSAQWLSLDTDYEDATLYDFISSDEEGPLENLEKSQQRKLLAEVIEKLDKQEKTVISLYYYEGLTQQEIAEVMELSPSRISQLHQKSIQRLRGFLSRKKEMAGGN